jgi:hypothetical protein
MHNNSVFTFGFDFDEHVAFAAAAAGSWSGGDKATAGDAAQNDGVDGDVQMGLFVDR